MKPFLICVALCLGSILPCYSQSSDSAKSKKDNTPHRYFIITAGTEIKAFYNDKPVSVETIEEFNEYVQKNVKSLKDSWVIVTGKPNNGTFNDVLKTLSRNRFKHISKNIVQD